MQILPKNSKPKAMTPMPLKFLNPLTPMNIGAHHPLSLQMIILEMDPVMRRGERNWGMEL